MVRTIVKIENLVKRYGSLVALDHLNLEVKEGEILGLLGPNGSGKTTALNCLLALLKYDKGTITVFDKEMHPTSYALKREIGVVPQNIAVFEKMTVQENIDYFCGLYVADKQRRRTLTEEAITFAGLTDYRKMLHDHLHIALYGGGRADLYAHCHHGSWEEHRFRDNGGVKKDDPDSRDHSYRRNCFAGEPAAAYP